MIRAFASSRKLELAHTSPCWRHSAPQTAPPNDLPVTARIAESHSHRPYIRRPAARRICPVAHPLARLVTPLEGGDAHSPIASHLTGRTCGYAERERIGFLISSPRLDPPCRLCGTGDRVGKTGLELPEHPVRRAARSYCGYESKRAHDAGWDGFRSSVLVLEKSSLPPGAPSCGDVARDSQRPPEWPGMPVPEFTAITCVR